ncbi:collagen alpha-3(VI) chain-like isoform X2 [Erinaceus europaeus]|uniref:von Willebrand factor A domain-containing protein 1 n=1 Tax=Erinaceus europaeus TaxID=9365 RepID=A0ABM3WU71_ERIEU|nr:collagen alpha-3(VI) chain-like isoform X2 [Erinaceus europaeus]
MRDVVLGVVQDLTVAESNCPRGARVAVVTYNDQVTTEIRFADSRRKAALLDRIRNIPESLTARQQSLESAVAFVARNTFKRVRSGFLVRKVAVIFSTKPARASPQLREAVLRLWDAGITPLFLTTQEDRQLASALQINNTAVGHTLVLPARRDLTDFLKKVLSCHVCLDVCNVDPACGFGSWRPTFRERRAAGSALDLDVAFLLDGGDTTSPTQFHAMKRFVAHVVGQLTLSPEPATSQHLTRVAVLQPGPSGRMPTRVDVGLTDFSSRERLLAFLDGRLGQLRGGRALGPAVDFALDQVFEAAPSPRAHRLLVILLTGPLAGAELDAAREATLRARCRGFLVVVLAVGRALDVREAAALASEPQDVFFKLVDKPAEFGRERMLRFGRLLPSYASGDSALYLSPELRKQCDWFQSDQPARSSIKYGHRQVNLAANVSSSDVSKPVTTTRPVTSTERTTTTTLAVTVNLPVAKPASSRLAATKSEATKPEATKMATPRHPVAVRPVAAPKTAAAKPVAARVPAPAAKPVASKPAAPRPQGVDTKPAAPRLQGVDTKPEAPRPQGVVSKPEAPRPQGVDTKSAAPRPQGVVSKPEAPRPQGVVSKPEAPRTQGVVSKPEAPRPQGVVSKPEAPRPQGVDTKPEAPRPQGVDTKPEAPRPQGVDTKPEAPWTQGVGPMATRPGITKTLVRTPQEVRVSQVTENSAKLQWDRPEPPSAYVCELSVTSAQDQQQVLRQNFTATERTVGGLRAGHTYQVAVLCSVRGQAHSFYQGVFSTRRAQPVPQPARSASSTVHLLLSPDPVTKTESCLLPMEVGTCRGYVVRWFYDPQARACMRFWFSGCGGNANRFSTQEECEKLCTPEAIAALEADLGMRRPEQEPSVLKEEQALSQSPL